MEEKPIAGIKGKKKSSMSLSLQALKDGHADAMLSCGNTGCLMAGGAIKLRTLEGVERPALYYMARSRKIFHAFRCRC